MKNILALFVAVLFCILFSFGCKKKSSPTPLPAGSQYTAKMGGSRTWQSHRYAISCSHPSTNYDNYSTDVFAIDIVNDTTIIFPVGITAPGGLRYNFTSYDSAKGTITFGDVLVYYYLSDAITYHYQYHDGVCSDIYFDTHTP